MCSKLTLKTMTYLGLYTHLLGVKMAPRYFGIDFKMGGGKGGLVKIEITPFKLNLLFYSNEECIDINLK